MDPDDVPKLLHALRHAKTLFDSDVEDRDRDSSAPSSAPDLDELVSKSRHSPTFRLALRDSPDILQCLESILGLARRQQPRRAGRSDALVPVLKILRNIGAAERTHSPSPAMLASELSLFEQLCGVLGHLEEQGGLDGEDLMLVKLLAQGLANWIKTLPDLEDAQVARIHSHLQWIVRNLPHDVSRFAVLDVCGMILASTTTTTTTIAATAAGASSSSAPRGVWRSGPSLSLFCDLVLSVQDVRLDIPALSSIQLWIGMIAESAFWAGRLKDLDASLSEVGLEYVLSALSGALEHFARSRTRRIPSGARDSLEYLTRIAHRVYGASLESQSVAEIQATPLFPLLPAALKCLGAVCAAPEADSADSCAQDDADSEQADMIVVLQELDLVGLVKGPLLRLSGGVTSREQLFTDRLSASRELYEGESCDVLALIGNACHRRPHISDDLVQRDGLLSVIGLCGKMDDSVSPFTKEWALWAMRNILECSTIARKYVSEMDTMGVVVPDFLAKLQK